MRHGDVTLAKSRAICFYIDHAFDGPPLVPRDPVVGARTEAVDLARQHAYRPAAGAPVSWAAYFFPSTPDGSPDRAAIDAALPKMEEQFAMLDRAVANTGHLVGDSFTLADINLLPILFYMAKMPESGAMLRARDQPRRLLPAPLARPSVIEATPPPFPGRQA